MTSNPCHSERHVKIVTQQLQIFKEESDFLQGVLKDYVHKIQREAQAWKDNHDGSKSYEEIIHAVRQATDFVISKSQEFSGSHTDGSLGVKMAKLQEDLFSLQNAFEKDHEKQEQVENKVKNVSTQQDGIIHKIDFVYSKYLGLLQFVHEREEKMCKVFSSCEVLQRSILGDRERLDRIELGMKSCTSIMRNIQMRPSGANVVMVPQDVSHRTDLFEKNDQAVSIRKDKVDASGPLCTELFETTNSKGPLITQDLVERSKELLDRITAIEKKIMQPIVGFFASAKLNYGCSRVQSFTTINNYGNHFDACTGTFTAPVNGVYLISFEVQNKQVGVNQFGLICRHQRGQPVNEREDTPFEFSKSFGSATYCAVMAAGDSLSLKGCHYFMIPPKMLKAGRFESQLCTQHELYVTYPGGQRSLQLVPIVDKNCSDIVILELKKTLFEQEAIPGYQNYEMVFVHDEDEVPAEDQKVVVDYMEQMTSGYEIEFHVRAESRTRP